VANGILGRIEVLSNTAFAPTFVRVIGVSKGTLISGETLTHDGRYLLTAAADGAFVISVARAESGRRHPVLGRLSSGARANPSAIEVATSPDDNFAFVSLEFVNEIAVFNLRSAIAHRFRTSALIGAIPLGNATVGMAISPNGRWLYATSEASNSPRYGSQGTLSVINLHRAETKPSQSVLATVTAGCSPVRAVVSPDGRTVWVTARESNALLGFVAAKLLTDPSHALSADVRVGQAPVGLAIVHQGRETVVAASNRFDVPGSTAELTVVDTAAALAGKPAVLGFLPAGLFPREESLNPITQTLLVTNWASRQLEAVNTTGLP
jgi:DNA-binding beta-propeller fold protein YncE